MADARPRRSEPIVLTATLATTLAAAFALSGCTSHDRAEPQPSRPSHRIAFQVDGTGTADIGYSTGTGSPAGRAPEARLPWRKSVPATGTSYTLTLVLAQSGGSANCSITVDGRTLAGSSAHGPGGRATCSTGTSRADD